MQLVDAIVDTPTQIAVSYTGDVDDTAFVAGTFTANPSGETSVSYSQTVSNNLLIEFSGTITTDTLVTYNGGTPGVLSPDQVAVAI